MMPRAPRWVVVLLLLMLLLAQVVPAAAQTPEPPSDDEVNQVAHELFCPICENIPLDVCPTEACRQWRGLIRGMLAEGRSEVEIQEYFVENYGARVLGKPPVNGINLLAYFLPPVAFIIGVILLFFGLRRSQGGKVKAPAVNGNEPAAEDEYLARLEEELKKRG